MNVAYEAAVAARFDALAERFKDAVAPDDFRLEALHAAFATLRNPTLLDLGCGKGRFAARLRERGANVIGLDRSRAMLGAANGVPRVLASATRLPYADGSFDGVFAVEVFEHLPRKSIDRVIAELSRVLRPGGIVAIIDKNAAALDARRPWLPGLAVKWIDERRGRWMYPAGGLVRECWFLPHAFQARLARAFRDCRVTWLLSPDESCHAVFRKVPSTRGFVIWTAAAHGGSA